MTKGAQPVCPCCRDAIDFDLDRFLLDETVANNVVIFAGAGISTENNRVAPHSLYIELAAELELNSCELPFPDLAEAYVQRPDGRFKLLRKIQDRFDYIEKFSDLRYESTKFYRELSTMPYFSTFITTNWDRNFENICFAKPFVYDADMRFWEIPDRKVLKIHGTIDDYSSIVATRTDYIEREAELHKSLIGSKLKEILATRTCVFVGYSMRDEDFQEIFSFVRSAQGKFEKTHYFVSPDVNSKILPKNIIPIKTDGTHFLSTIKTHMYVNYCYIADDIYESLAEELEEVIEAHTYLWDRFDGKQNPQVLVCASYQDGLIHGYRLILDRMGTGQYSDLHRVQSKIAAYGQKIDDYRSKRRYLDVAYFEGFRNTLIALAVSKASEEFVVAQRYYHEGIGEMDKDEFEDSFDALPDVHKSAYRLCKRIVANWPANEVFVMQHTPWG